MAGALVTGVFSGSLAWLTTQAQWEEVLLIGMIVPTFTWLVQLTAAAVLLPAHQRDRYWAHLGWICLLGSFVLLPVGLVNLVSIPDGRFLTVAGLRIWSAAGVLASVAIMAAALFRLTRRDGIPDFWPISWCITITINMTLFVLSSWHWW